jgi:hypothetical protein
VPASGAVQGIDATGAEVGQVNDSHPGRALQRQCEIGYEGSRQATGHQG